MINKLLIYIMMLLLGGCALTQDKSMRDSDPRNVHLSGDATISAGNRRGF